MEMITGSDCTKRQPHQKELPGGTTATLRRIETGGDIAAGIQMNPTATLYASGTRRTGSPTSRATTNTTTLARHAQVACLRTNFVSIPDLSICA